MSHSKRYWSCTVARVLLPIAALILGACNSNPSSPTPAAATPVVESISANDPQGFPNPAGAPFFQIKLLKFRVPTGTDIQVSIEGWIARQQGTPASCDE